MEKTLVVLLSKATEHNNRYYSEATDLYRDISDAARQVSSFLRLTRPSLSGIFCPTHDNKESDKNDGMGQDEPLDAIMFLALVRVLLKREIEKLPAFENITSIKDDDIFQENNHFDFNSETHDTFEETQLDIDLETNFYPAERVEYCDNADERNEADVLFNHFEKPIDETCDRYHPCCQMETNDSIRNNSLDHLSLSKDNNASFPDIRPDFEDIEPDMCVPTITHPQTESHKKQDDNAAMPGCWANSAGPSKEFSESEKHTISAGVIRESVGLIDWNELCADRSNVSEVEHAQFSEDGDGASNRITYNTKPTDSTYPTTPVFVCSAATMNTDALQFGEELSEIGVATNFNVNAINNKDPIWKGVKGDLTPDETRPKDTNNPNPSSSEDGTNSAEATLMSASKCWTFLQDTKWWICLRHTAAQHWPGPGDHTATTVLCVLVAICVLLLVATGNVFSLVGVVLDVIVHAALLSLVVIIAITVHEANDDASNPFTQWCNTFLEIMGCVETPDNAKRPKECQPTSQSAHPLGGGDSGCYGDNAENTGGGGCDGDHEKYSKMAALDVEDVDDSGLNFSIVQDACALSPSGSKRRHRKCKSESCDVSTMTDGIDMTDCPTWCQNGKISSFSEANTTEEPKSLASTSVQTDALCEDGDAVVNYLPINDDGEVTQSRDVVMRSVDAQANIDAQKINEYAIRLQQRHQRNMRRLQRKFLAIRRRMRRDAHQLKSCDQQRGDFLAKLQLTVPTLQMEKNRLTAERFMFERQYMYQRKKNQDLVGRITKLNQQFQVLGQTHQPPTATAPWRPPHLNRNITPCANLFGGPQADIQQQQQQQQQHQQQQRQEQTKSTLTSNIKTTTQITLTQPLTPPSVPNKWLNNLQQQQQLQQILPPPPAPPQQLQQMKHHQQQQQQQQQQVQQARLSIFQLLRNSASLATHPDDNGQQSINEEGK